MTLQPKSDNLPVLQSAPSSPAKHAFRGENLTPQKSSQKFNSPLKAEQNFNQPQP